ncbi:MAG: DUF2723 domain-containing protein [Anaerolineae bacterium]|nr:DUF2723 domain-containing protein [Anaerolineae bacterium]
MIEDASLEKIPWRLAIGITLVSLLLYIVTLAPDMLWGGGDFAIFQTRAYALEIEAGVLGHPLWVILAHPFTYLPIRNVAWRANLASAVFASLSVLFIFLSTWHLTRSRAASFFATGALIVSHTFWTYAVLPKVYSLNGLLLSSCIYLMLRWQSSKKGVYLYMFTLVYCIGQFNHLLMATAGLGFAVFVIGVFWNNRHLSAMRWQIFISTLIGVLCFLPYLLVMLLVESSGDSVETAGLFLRGLGYAVTNPKALLMGLGWGTALLLYQFPITIIAGFLGIRQCGKEMPLVNWLLLLIVLADVAFLMAAVDPRTGKDYVWNLHFYHPTYVVFSLWIAVGINYLFPKFTKLPYKWASVVALTLLVPVIAYITAPQVAKVVLGNVPGFRELPGRDNFTFVLSPWKQNETQARALGESMLAALPKNSVILADYSLWSMIRYLQVVEGQRPDVTLIKMPIEGGHAQLPLIKEYSPKAEVFIADIGRYYDMEEIEEYFEVIPVPPIYQVIAKED